MQLIWHDGADYSMHIGHSEDDSICCHGVVSTRPSAQLPDFLIPLSPYGLSCLCRWLLHAAPARDSGPELSKDIGGRPGSVQEFQALV